MAVSSESTADPLLERDADLRDLGRVLERAAAHTGGVAVVSAAPGLGKTRLLAAVSERARELDMIMLRARGSVLEQHFVFGVVRQLFEPVAEPENLDGGAGLARSALWGDASPRPSPPASAALFHGLYWLVAHVAARRPMLVAVDDAHLADAASFDFLRYLAARVADLDVALVLATRPEKPRDTALLGLLGARVVEPGPLSGQAVHDLVSARLGADANADFARACHETTGGNPFYVSALLDELTAHDVEPSEARAAQVRELVPPSVARTVLARLDRCSAQERRLATALAILGDGAAPRHAAALADCAREVALAAVDNLADAGLIWRGRPLRFTYPVVGSAIHSTIPEAQKELGHRRAAELLMAEGQPAESVAAHLVLLEPRGDLATVEWLERAAEEAARRGMAKSAVAYLRRAIAEPPAGERRGELLAKLGVAEMQTGQKEAVAHLEEALMLIEDPARRAQAEAQLAMALSIAGAVPRAVERLAAAIASVEGDDPNLALRLEAQLVGVAKMDSTAVRVLRARTNALRETIAGGLEADETLPAEVVFQDMLAGVPARELVRRAISLVPATPPVDVAALPHYAQLLFVLEVSDEAELAERLWGQLVTAAGAMGSSFLVGFASAHRARVRYRRGALRDSEEDAHSALDLLTAQGWNAGAAGALAYVIQVLIDCGRPDEAEALLEDRLPGPSIADGVAANFLLESRASLRLAQELPADALDDLFEFAERERHLRARNPACSLWRTRAVSALAALGRLEEARQLADEELALARGFGAAGTTGAALRSLGALVGDAGILREAVALLESSPARLEHARALTDLGVCLRRGGSTVESRAVLRDAYPRAAHCGATALRERAYAELRLAGGRPRRLENSGVGSLTPSERRIAALAAHGASNREIAEGAFLSLKTVEMHLSHVYRKLGIASRHALAAALDEAAP